MDAVLHSAGKLKGLTVRDGDGARHDMHCGAVVNCAGPWYNKVVAELDLDIRLTLTPVRIQVVYKDAPECFTAEALASHVYGAEAVPAELARFRW